MTLRQALTGQESCGCFGTFKTNPSYVAAFDAAILAALALSRPTRSAHPGLRAAALWLALALLAAPSVAVLAQRPVSSSASANGLISDGYVHDFGTISAANAGAQEHRFVLRNVSDRDIRIIEKTSTCGCTIAELASMTISRGASVEVNVKANWAGRVGPQMEGVELKTDHAESPQVRLTVQAVIPAGVGLWPSAINFGTLTLGKRETRVVRITRGTETRALKITGVTSSSPAVTVTRNDVPSQGDGVVSDTATFTVTAVSAQPRGRQHATVLFHTNLADVPTLKLHVDAEFKRCLTAKPASVFLQPSRTAQIRITSSCGGALPTVELPPSGTRPGPFYIISVKPAEDDASAVTVMIAYRQENLVAGLNRAELTATSGGDTLGVQITAMGRQ